VKTKMLAITEFVQISKYFKALGDDTRIKIMWALFNHEMCVCDIANLLSMTKSAISHQLKELKDNNLIKSRKEGKTVFYSLFDKHISIFIKNAYIHSKE
jgi:ArsR family transcriptional regulator